MSTRATIPAAPGRQTRSMGLRDAPSASSTSLKAAVTTTAEFRIVSWNMQKAGIERGMTTKKLFQQMDGLGANVLVIQEPGTFMITLGSGTKTVMGGNHTWSARTFAGGSQGTIVVAYNDQVNASALSNLGSVGLGQGTKRITADNPIVACTLSRPGGGSVSLATFHSPFDMSARALFATRAIDLAHKDGIGIILGDFNTYGVTNPASTKAKRDYDLMLASPTSGVGSTNSGDSSPLDKIVANRRYVTATRRRIIPAEGSKAPARGAPSSNVEDLVEKGWKTTQDVPSDHLPVYIDIGPETIVQASVGADDGEGETRPIKRQRVDSAESEG